MVNGGATTLPPAPKATVTAPALQPVPVETVPALPPDFTPGVVPIRPGEKPAPVLPGETVVTVPPVNTTGPVVVVVSSPPVPPTPTAPIQTAPTPGTVLAPSSGPPPDQEPATGREPASLDTAALGPQWTHDQLETLWEINGGPAFAADTAAAIAQAESSGCQYAKAGPSDDRPKKTCTYRKTTTENSYGLWQVNRQAHPTYSPDELYDANGNAAAAVEISNGGADFSPWTTYRNGAYKQYLKAGTAPLGGSTSSSTGSSSSTTKAPAALNKDWKNLLAVFSSSVPQAKTRMGKSGSLLVATMTGAKSASVTTGTTDSVPPEGDVL